MLNLASLALYREPQNAESNRGTAKMIFAYLCRIASLAPLAILILKVHNHGWTVLSIIVGLFLTVIMFWLGVVPEYRGRRLDARFLIALITVVGIAAFW